MSSQGFTFSAIKGVQAGMEYYVCMVPLSLLPKIFVFDDVELSPDVRAQRLLNKARIPEMRDYILDNQNSYVFSALTASVDARIEFTPVSPATAQTPALGMVEIPLTARFLINDGQHRKAAIEAAIKKEPKLKYEHISIVLYEDMGLKRSQQIFSDLNRYAIRPTKSLNILYDSRDDFSAMICRMVEDTAYLQGWVEKERGTISNRSTALFTLSGLYHGTQNLIQELPEDTTSEDKETFIRTFWEIVYKNMPEWQDVVNKRAKSVNLRQQSVCGHTIALLALGNLGCYLYSKYHSWDKCNNLLRVDWHKAHPLWDGTVVVGNKISGNRASVKYLSDKLIEIVEE